MADPRRDARPGCPMTHKAALAVGRTEGPSRTSIPRCTRAANSPKRGRKRTPDSIQKRLKAIDAELASADPLSRAQAGPGADEPESELGSMGAKVDLAGLEDGVRRGGPRLQRAPRHQLRSVAGGRGARRRCSSGPASAAGPRAADAEAAAAAAATPGPPSTEPSSSWLARSGCGIMPDDVAAVRADTGDVVDASRWGCPHSDRTIRSSACSSAQRRRRRTCSCPRSG